MGKCFALHFVLVQWSSRPEEEEEEDDVMPTIY